VPDDHGLANKFGMLEQLHGGKEGIHVDVQDGGGQVVTGVGGDLPAAAVLLAHGSILAPADDGAPSQAKMDP
jgi:hypothetical protein